MSDNGDYQECFPTGSQGDPYGTEITCDVAERALDPLHLDGRAASAAEFPQCACERLAGTS
jgi:hypothetical protein